MTYNKPDTKLDECIYIAEKIIPADLCDVVVKDIETRPWEPNYWRDNRGNSLNVDQHEYTTTRELDMQIATPQLQNKIMPFVLQSGTEYNKKYAYNKNNDLTSQIMHTCGNIRFNRYGIGQTMKQHYDHIHNIFDGELKGVPVLSFILNFNDDYEGADLFFWEDTVVPLGKGDIIMFPSNWLFPHGVTEAIKGKRYSGSVWGW